MDTATAIVFTTYFTSKGNPVHDIPVERDALSYIGDWYTSLHALGLHGTVFHDGLSDAFVAEHRTEQVDFVFADPADFTYSLNDQRFFLYLAHLQSHPKIERLFLTDGSDVRIASDPFGALEPDRIYAGSEEATLFPPPLAADHLYAMERLAAAGLHDFRAALASSGKRRPILNAGILGGQRDVVLEALRAITELLSAIGRPEENLNMGVFNYALYTRFEDRLQTGAPVHSRFGAFERDRRDVWFIHK
jgi:hypothetical protein